LPNARVKPLRPACWGCINDLTLCRSSGVNITTYRSTLRARRAMGRNRDRWRYQREGLPATI
jgi:hypothetical protein